MNRNYEFFLICFIFLREYSRIRVERETRRGKLKKKSKVISPQALSTCKLSLSNLNDDCINEIFSYLPQKELIFLSTTNKQIGFLARRKLFKRILVSGSTSHKQCDPIIHNSILCGITEMRQSWTVISPRNFQRLLSSRSPSKRNVSEVRIDYESFSREFIHEICMELPYARIYFFGDEGVEERTFVNFRTNYLLQRLNILRIRDTMLFDYIAGDNIPVDNWISSLSIVISEHGNRQSSLALENFSKCFSNLTTLELEGNAFSFFRDIDSSIASEAWKIQSLRLDFGGVPTEMCFSALFGQLTKIINPEGILKLRLNFLSTYHIKGEGTNHDFINEATIVYVESISSFLKTLCPSLNSIKELSIESADPRDNQYSLFKQVIPEFDRFIQHLPHPLVQLKLSIGNEVFLQRFLPAIGAHQKSLRKVVWNGNLDSPFLGNEFYYRGIRFDIHNSGKRIYPFSSRLRYSVSSEVLNRVERRIIQEMQELSMQRISSGGDDTQCVQLVAIPYGTSRIQPIYPDGLLLAGILQYQLTEFLNQNADEFLHLTYLVVNGVHFSIKRDFDKLRMVRSIYDIPVDYEEFARDAISVGG